MIEFIRDAGVPVVIPTLFFGLVAIVLAARYARRPSRPLLEIVIGSSIATMLMGFLGFVLGIQASARTIGQVAADERWIFLIGVKESLNNVVAALVMVLIVSLLATAGRYRSASTGSAREVQEHAA
jgi:hypothetical protein